MAAWRCGAGQTLLIPSGPTGHHLFVLLNDPRDFRGQRPQSCVSVSLCTIRTELYDGTCIVRPGEHQFVREDSYVSYRQARVDPADVIHERVNSSTFIPHQPASPELLLRLLAGLRTSPHTKPFIKALGL